MLKTKFHTTKLYIIIRYSKGFRPLKPRRERVGIKLGNLGKILGNYGSPLEKIWVTIKTPNGWFGQEQEPVRGLSDCR